ncbi:soluble lytic murein transglycosylase [Desulfurobacterium pacificum]|uniref:Soluble lytic murein transglycosylase n=1 Tax=Desulfurobacterium pacificum TaxID=240166 RepID=A0ABY1NI74_9BACT|nr:transglycosylase SLT domain-containing protein [Desulfurobacterium pacificum]SMP10331.1 soluble lytic murein transglycosylase [Desulfurobacterium pacificum]
MRGIILRIFGILFLSFVSLSSQAETLKAKRFIGYLQKGNFCSTEFLKEFNGTIFSTLSKELYVLNCPVENENLEVKNPYVKFIYAKKLKKQGKTEEAKKLFKEIFSSTNRLDPEIITANAGDTKYLFTPEVLRKKVWIAIKDREFAEAEVYLSFLKTDPFYNYFKGIIQLKRGNYRKAKEYLESSNIPLRYFFLIYVSKEPAEKFFYFRKLLTENVPAYYKKAASVYLLDRFLVGEGGFYRKMLDSIKTLFPKVYRTYRIKYEVINYNYEKAINLIATPQNEKEKVWRETLKAKLGFKSDYSFLIGKKDFYALLLSKPKKVVKEGNVEISNPDIKYLLSNNYCPVISLLDLKSKDIPLALYKCGYYSAALKAAVKLKVKKPLQILYPKPKIFGDDFISLAIARQESLFNHLALSRSGAIGLMQIMPLTGRYLAKKLGDTDFFKEKLFIPEVNYRFGSFYIHSLLKKFKSFPLAAAAYNCGPGNLKKALKNYGKIKTKEDLIIFVDFYLPFKETRDYVKKVSRNLYFYSNLYGTGQEWKSFLKP